MCIAVGGAVKTAVWSLLATGRSASEYIDYVWREYRYVHTDASLRVRHRTRRPWASATRGGAAQRRGAREVGQPSQSSNEMCAMWMDVRGGDGGGMHGRRMYVRAIEMGTGLLLLIQAALPAISTEPSDAANSANDASAHADTSDSTWSSVASPRERGRAHAAQDSAVSGQAEDEQELMTWIDGIEMSTIPEL